MSEFKELSAKHKVATVFFAFLSLLTLGVLTFPIIKLCIDRFKPTKPAGAEIMQIFVKHVDGKCYTLDVHRGTTLDEIKQQLSNIQKPMSARADFLFAGKRHQEGTTTLQMINVQKESTLHVVLRLGVIDDPDPDTSSSGAV